MAPRKSDPAPNSTPAPKTDTTYQGSRGGSFPAPAKPIPGTPNGSGGRLRRG